MISKKVLQSLSEDEAAILLHLTNVIHPPGFGIKVNYEILSAYKKDALIQICAHYRDRIKPEYESVYDTMVAKLNGHLSVTTNDTTETRKSDEHDYII
jgi:hypothetical protein